MNSKSLIYVAYAPYENQGKILDYILENFSLVFLFTIGHHNLGSNKSINKLTIYQNGKVVGENDFKQFKVPPQLVFLLLPLRSVFNFINIITRCFLIKRKYGKSLIYFSVNGFAAWIGLVVKYLGIADKTVYWICDYYPAKHTDKIIAFMRRLYWEFEKFAAKSDKLVFHNRRLVKVWRDSGLIPPRVRYTLIPIATNKSRIKKNKSLKNVKLAFLGVIKKSQGLDFVYDSANALKRKFRNIQLEVLGSGPDLDYFKKRAKKTKLKSKFYGYVSENTIDKVLYKSTIGIAPYMPDPTAVSYYGDPGKIKRYISNGLPVIATNIHEFPKELKKNVAGEIVEYKDIDGLVNSVKNILKSYNMYSRNATKLNDTFYYKKIYKEMFI